VQQAECAHHIGAGKEEWGFDGAVYVALCRQMNDAVDIILLHNGAHALKVADVCLDEGVVRLPFNITEVGEVAGIGEGIQIDDAVLRVFVHEEPHKVRPDEAGSAGDEDVHDRRIAFDEGNT